ncbi:hypothetical protein HJC23_011325 [Cyclotella cryptica]|uniref:Peptidase S49 domain-containing protein n=1 Tax=Cyclotella cryptica TaxID=29204 RepID=A0ABD3QW11_9STRA
MQHDAPQGNATSPSKTRKVSHVSPVSRGMLVLGGKIKNFAGGSFRISCKAVGLVAAVNVAWYYYDRWSVNEFFGENFTPTTDEDGKVTRKPLKKVLLLPLDCLKVVEKRKTGNFDMSSLLQQRNKQPTIVLETKELVDIIQKAAADPNISALYADFGEGMRYPLEYAHIEEIRNALRIFNESHRVHRSPNIDHNPVFALPRNGNPKVSFAFGHSFGWREYFLASAFSNIHLQPRGHLALGGTTVSNIFLRDMLVKYGIKAHVFKHGDFKTAPNAFTERGYSRTHLENVQSTTASLNNTIRTCIQNSRALKFDDVMWKSIFDYGSLTASNAKEIGLVDSTPAIGPMSFMIEASKNAKAKSKMEDKFGVDMCPTNFNATETVSVVEYKQMLDKKTRLDRTQLTINNYMNRLSELSTATSLLLSGLGIRPSKSLPNQKIAVVSVDGNITSSLSFRIVQSLRQIRNDKEVKCLVLRVNSGGGSVVSSEAILEELNTLDVPVICSMGNYAASGGYYIASNSKRVFAQPTTLTGSIGVFLVKFDASEWAKSYGIRSDYYPHGSQGAVHLPLTPLTQRMRDNLERLSLGFYDYFKGIVAAGRSLTVEEIEKIAQGRVWTGEQAKEIGLVDSIGGLDRAITYAKSTYTKSDAVSVEHWPKTTFSLADFSGLLLSGSSLSDILSSTLQSFLTREETDQSCVEKLFCNLTQLNFDDKPHFMLAMDEKTAIELIVMGE